MNHGKCAQDKTGLPSHVKRCRASALTATEAEQLTSHPAWNVASLSICKVTWHPKPLSGGSDLLSLKGHHDDSGGINAYADNAKPQAVRHLTLGTHMPHRL